jgi:ankyrin repeat protein
LTVIERRNHQGKTSLLLALEHDHSEIASYILKNFIDDLDMEKADSISGSNALHLATQNNNLDLAKIISEKTPHLSLK